MTRMCTIFAMIRISGAFLPFQRCRKIKSEGNFNDCKNRARLSRSYIILPLIDTLYIATYFDSHLLATHFDRNVWKYGHQEFISIKNSNHLTI